jgi:porin
MKARRYSFPCALIALAFGAGPLWAQSAAQSIGITEPLIATSLPQYGDPFGTRKWLNDRGITYSLIYTNDVLGNLSGGIRTGTIDQGKLETQL